MEDYFDWYDMNDTQRIHFTKMRLVGAARTYWHTVEVTLEEQGQPPVTTWARMKMKLKEKYVSPQYKCQLFSKLNNISQTFTVADYIADRKSTRLNSSHSGESRMPSSA